MKKVLVLPTWLIVKMIQPMLPKLHPWKNGVPSLEDWSYHSTGVCKVLSLYFWMSLVNLIVLYFIF